MFMSKAACTQCHNGPNFTDNKFHVLGVPQKGPLVEDVGRYGVTKDDNDKGAFKTPSLRNIALTAPYTHDGAFETLEEVVEFYNQGGGSVLNKSPKLLKLHLTKQEKGDLVAFLKALTGAQPVVSMPQLPKEN
jgi:cytochrome c peroxidase